jgi:SAM-dependent methyltransferase
MSGHVVHWSVMIAQRSDPEHWEQIWSGRAAEDVTWFQDHPERSLALITSVTGPQDRVLDVGGGASRLVDRLLDLGYRDVTVVDIAASSLEASRTRLGARAAEVTWVVDDATTLHLARPVALWHDRAVFHFLVDRAGRRAYIERVNATVFSGGHVAIAAFGPNGPQQCSGLPVRRYSPDDLADEFGPGFEFVAGDMEQHVSPTGVTQEFAYALLRHTG